LGSFPEGRRHGEEALRLATLAGRGALPGGGGALPVLVHACLGHLYSAQGDLEHAIEVFEQGLALCRTSGDRTNGQSIASSLGAAYARQGRLAEGRALLEEASSDKSHTGALHNHSL